jgi:uncharacterized protein YegP (UPF0339 family)
MLNLMEIWIEGYPGKRRQRCLVSGGGKDAASGIPHTERIAMAGIFELFMDSQSAFRFRLTAPDGTVMAVSKPFDTKSDAVAGIAAVRETNRQRGSTRNARLRQAGALKLPRHVSLGGY